MKTCCRCKEHKPFDQYHKHSGKKDGLQPFCKACKKLAYDEYYKTDKERARLKALKQRTMADRKEYINAIKEQPCSDCKTSYPYYVMDFDHVVEPKLFDVSSAAASGRPWQLILDEIAKCEVVCSNCHRQRTHERLAR